MHVLQASAFLGLLSYWWAVSDSCSALCEPAALDRRWRQCWGGVSTLVALLAAAGYTACRRDGLSSIAQCFIGDCHCGPLGI
jgi:hypothetical protein